MLLSIPLTQCLVFIGCTAREQFDSNAPGVAAALLHIACVPPSPADI